MIYKPDQKVMKSLAVLQSNQNFQHILHWLQECLVRTHQDGDRQIEEYKMRWHQGAAQDITEFLKLAEESKRLL